MKKSVELDELRKKIFERYSKSTKVEKKALSKKLQANANTES